MVVSANKFLFVISVFLSSVAIAGDGSVFKYDKNYGAYSKVESSGCITMLQIKPGSNYISLSYGDACDISSSGMESVKDIAKSVGEIVNHYQLGKAIQSKKGIDINIIWKISHWHLYDYLNESKFWPSNAVSFLKENFVDQDQRYANYKTLLGKAIKSEKVYQPFTTSLKEFGCLATLSDNYADPIYSIVKRNVTKKNLIEWKVFQADFIHKEFFPEIKGPIFFDLSCS